MKTTTQFNTELKKQIELYKNSDYEIKKQSVLWEITARFDDKLLIKQLADYLVEYDNDTDDKVDDNIITIANSEKDISNYHLLKWLESDLRNAMYVDDAIATYGVVDKNIFEIIRNGYFDYCYYILQAIRNEIDRIIEMGENNEK